MEDVYKRQEPGELEMVTLGPVTNLAWISLRSPGTLAKLKRITMMMGTGPYFGNATPLAEGNARMDPELSLIHIEMCIRDRFWATAGKSFRKDFRRKEP